MPLKLSYVATFPNSQLPTFNFTHRFLGSTLAEMEGNKKRRSNNESLDPKSIKKSKVCAPIHCFKIATASTRTPNANQRTIGPDQRVLEEPGESQVPQPLQH